MRELNNKQTAFVREYLVDFNATKAAIRAGYSAKTAGQIGHELLKKPEIQQRLREFQQKAAEETQTDINWVRERLKAEATDHSEFASHSARIKAIELIARLNGDFEKDNKQKADPLAEAIRSLSGNVLGTAPVEDDEDDE